MPALWGTEIPGLYFHLVALGGLPEGDRGLHPGACAAGAQGEPRNDPGVKTVHRSECPSWEEGAQRRLWGAQRRLWAAQSQRLGGGDSTACAWSVGWV
jgi:hypothetical protein